MRISLIAFGTRGDVTPIVALAVRLRSIGYRVRLVSHADFEPLAAQQKLDFHPTGGSYQQLVASTEGRRALGVPRSTPLGLLGLFNPFRDCAEIVFRECWEACGDADAIACSPLASVVGSLIASARGLPLAIGSPIPPPGSRFMPAPVFPAWPLGQPYSRLTNKLTRTLVLRGASKVFAAWYREALRITPTPGLPPVPTVTLVASSPIVVPRPPDWPETTHVTGYWFLPKQAAPAVPAHVRDFIDSGPPPICLGFGSMADNDPDKLRALVLEAIARLKTRAIIVGGSGGALLGFAQSNSVCEASFVDYDWLFRRVSVVVHQGGAGTAAFCLAAGVPQVIVPYCLDHTFWASRLQKLGVTPPSVTRNRLTAGRLAKMIRTATENPAYRSAAEALAPRIAAEDGLDRATRILQTHVGRPRIEEFEEIEI